MKIGIDIRLLGPGARTGIGRYLMNLLQEYAKHDFANDYILMYNSFKGPLPSDIPAAKNISVNSIHLPNRLLNILWAYSSFPNVENFIGDIDIFHSANSQMPPAKKAARVVTIHDLTYLTHPDLAIPAAVRHLKPRIKFYAARADLIVVDSMVTGRDVVNYLDMPDEKVVVVYCGASALKKAAPDKIETTKRRHGINGPFILFVGCLEPRKNLPGLLKAFELSGLSRDFELILAGPLGWRNEKLLEIWHSITCKDKIRWLGYVNDDDLAALYGGAEFLAFPSLMEGFGLPILEAMSVGCPVLTSNTSSMPEVAGDAALYVDPLDVDSIADGLRRLAADEMMRNELAAKGYGRIKEFSWEKSAHEMINAYCRAYELRQNRNHFLKA